MTYLQGSWARMRSGAKALVLCAVWMPALAMAQSADIVVNHSDSPDPGPAGGVFTYTLRLDNNGPNLAQGVTLADTLPSGATFVDVNTTKGTCAAPVAGVVNCSIGDIAFTSSETVTVRVRLPAAGVYSNTVTSGASTPDSNNSNNTNSIQNTTALAAANLAVNASASSANVAAGQGYTYTVSVNNQGPDEVPVGGSIRLSFAVPTGSSITNAPTGSGWSCTPSGGYPLSTGTVACTRTGTLANGAGSSNLDIPAVANVTGAVTASFSAAASKADASAMPDSDLADNTATVTVTAASGSDVSVAISASPTNVALGSNVTYTITPRHEGGEAPGSSGLITVTDTLPAGLSLVSATGSGWTCGAAGQVVTCTRPGPYTGGNFTNMPVITLVATATTVGSFSNTATVSIPETDSNPANNSASVSVTSTNDADLRLTKTASLDPVVPNQGYSYSLVVRNQGPLAIAAGQTITVTDTLPAGVVLTAVPSGTGWTCSPSSGFPLDGATVSCTRPGPLAVNVSAPTITLSAIQTLAGTRSNMACVALSGAGPVDSTAGNDCSSASVSATATQADLEVVSKTATPTTVAAGSDLTYVITVRNNGPETSTNVRVSDTLSSLVNTGGLQSVVPSQGSCTPAAPRNGTSQNLVCDLGTLTSGATATVTVVVRPSIATTDNRTNRASVTSLDVGDPNRNNNSNSVTSTVTAKVDIRVAKTATPASVPAGAPLTYVATVTNDGPSIAQTVRLLDTLPTNATFISATASGTGTCTTPAVGAAGGSLDCTWGSINSGAQQTVTYKVRPLLSAVGGTLVNAVAVTTTTAEDNTTNNSATTTTPVTPAQLDVLINKTDSSDPVNLGDETTYTITITNSGPSYATNPVMVDTFPAPGSTPTATFSYEGALTVSNGGACTQPTVGATSGVLRCTFAGLDAGQSATVTYKMRAQTLTQLGATSGTAFNRATVSVDEVETQMLNNSVDESTTARRNAAALPTDLSITKTGPTGPVKAGDLVNYTITVRNNGPQTSTSAQMQDVLPTGLSFVSAPGCLEASGTVTCPVGTLAVGASVVFNVSARLNTPYTGASPLVNTAVVDAVGDTDSTNNSASASTPVATATPASIPTLSEWALMLMAALLGLLAMRQLPQRRR